MKKYLVVFLLISGIVGLSVILYNYQHPDLELIFTLDPDNYDILEFIYSDNNAIYLIFLLVNLFLINLTIFKNYFDKFFTCFEIYQPSNFTSKLHTRSPPLV